MNKPIIINVSPGAPRDSLIVPGDSAVSLPAPGVDYSRLRELEEDYLHYLREERDFSSSSITTYRNEFNRFLSWLEENPEPISRDTFIRYRTYLKDRYSPSSVNLAMVGIRRYLNWLCDIGEIPVNPALGIEGIKQRGRGKAHKRDGLTPSEARRLLDMVKGDSAVNARDKAIIGAMLFGGIRTIEAHRALLGDYRTKQDRRILLLQGKGTKDRDSREFIVITPELEGILANWLSCHPRGDDPRAPLFCSLSRRSFGEPLSLSAMRRIIKARFREAGIRESSKTTHSLRHSAITAVIRGGGSLLQAQTFARHESPETTKIYIHTADRLENPPEELIKY